MVVVGLVVGDRPLEAEGVAPRPPRGAGCPGLFDSSVAYYESDRATTAGSILAMTFPDSIALTPTNKCQGFVGLTVAADRALYLSKEQGRDRATVAALALVLRGHR